MQVFWSIDDAIKHKFYPYDKYDDVYIYVVGVVGVVNGARMRVKALAFNRWDRERS